MRREFIEVETKEEAEDLALWAAIIVQCYGGWMAYYETWSKQV